MAREASRRWQLGSEPQPCTKCPTSPGAGLVTAGFSRHSSAEWQTVCVSATWQKLSLQQVTVLGTYAVLLGLSLSPHREEGQLHCWLSDVAGFHPGRPGACLLPNVHLFGCSTLTGRPLAPLVPYRWNAPPAGFKSTAPCLPHGVRLPRLLSGQTLQHVLGRWLGAPDTQRHSPFLCFLLRI